MNIVDIVYMSAQNKFWRDLLTLQSRKRLFLWHSKVTSPFGCLSHDLINIKDMSLLLTFNHHHQHLWLCPVSAPSFLFYTMPENKELPDAYMLIARGLHYGARADFTQARADTLHYGACGHLTLARTRIYLTLACTQIYLTLARARTLSLARAFFSYSHKCALSLQEYSYLLCRAAYVFLTLFSRILSDGRLTLPTFVTNV